MSECPGDPSGHLWHLDSERALYEPSPKLPWRGWRRWAWTLLGLCVPIFGWMVLHFYIFETHERRVGTARRWYCERCREFETTRERA